jgi:hypothetical protein
LNEPVDITAQTHRFNQAARAFTTHSTKGYVKLLPFKEGIVELRQKGASLQLIRELLATTNVAVGTGTIAQFLAEVNGESLAQPTAKRRTAVRSPVARRPDAPPIDQHVTPAVIRESPIPMPAAPTQPQSPSSAPADAAPTIKPTERSRIRGPRIADPANL